MATVRTPSPRAAAPLPGARRRSALEPAAQEQQADQGLRVAALVDDGVELLERPRLDRDPLAHDLLARRVGEARREVDVALLVGEPCGGEVGREVLPVLGRLADLLGELPAAALERALPLLVELAGRELE